MKRLCLLAAISVTASVVASAACAAESRWANTPQVLRPPAVPLVTHDPYFSIWSFGDELAGSWPKHWTGAVHALCSVVRVDGQGYRLVGMEPKDVPAAKQTALRVLPTRTIYRFEAGPVRFTLTFTTPVLPEDLDLVSRPVTYLTWTAEASDGKPHEVAVYFDATGELVVNKPEQAVTWSRKAGDTLAIMRMGSKEQPILAKDGDNLRIDWGYLYVAVPHANTPCTVIGPAEDVRRAFADTAQLPERDDTDKPRPARERWPVLAALLPLGTVAGNPVSTHLMLAYDDKYSIQYMGTNLRPWWRRDGARATDMLEQANADYAALTKRCEAFDAAVMADMARVGGPRYAVLCALAYRHVLAAHKLAAAPDGTPMLFSKECFSNGCIGTVDVAYPASPMFMLFSNDLLKASLEPVFRYAAMERWPFDFAPHDLGRYPKANGQRYGGGEKTEDRQMPVEESGNMLIMTGVVSHIDSNVDYARQHWPLLSKWAHYLKAKGLDPENQLCTDDFAGHLAHNVNLSAKAIVAMALYARMARTAGREDEADAFRRTAEDFARRWKQMADDGDHYRLAFDRTGTWSQKYNLVWDRVLDLDLFGPDVAEKEVAFYKTRLNRFGLPLDNRSTYTKTDWEVWTATLARSEANWNVLMDPVYAFVNHTPQRVPLTDWYWTETAERRGFQARPVIGGLFIKALTDARIWKTYAGRSRKRD
jgi:hypothetical protein